MCMVGRTILIHGEARKNKSYRKKYFVLNIGPDYTNPRLDYFSNVDKWNQHKDEIYEDISEGLSFRSIDLSNLFCVDDVYRSKPKHGGLDLYMEDKHVILILISDDVKKKWKEVFENVIYKNGKMKSYPKIEHTLQVGLRLKPKENIEKSVLLQWKGDYRACFMKTSLVFVNKDLNNPNFTVQYPFIRQWESRFDGTFRLEIGRAALLGECFLILQLSDYAESKAAHSMLTNCIKCFKMTRPEPPRLRNGSDKSSNRNSSISYCRQSSLGKLGSTCATIRSESCMGFSKDYFSVLGSQPNNSSEGFEDEKDSSYMSMNETIGDNFEKSNKVSNYIEHISRIYKCSKCSHLTKVVTFCSRCTSPSYISSLQMLCKTEVLPNAFKTKLLPSVRDKAQSLTERPIVQSLSIKTPKQKQSFSETNKSGISQTSQSSSKTSTNEMSSSSKQESQNSLSISANRHDDDIFMELDFDNLEPPKESSSKSKQNKSDVKCCFCSSSLFYKSPTELSTSRRCSKCLDDMLSLSMLIENISVGNENQIQRSSILFSDIRPAVTYNSDYVEVNLGKNKFDPLYMDSFCS